MNGRLQFHKTDGAASFSVLLIHGTADHADSAEKLARMVNTAKPDLVLFEGDTVSESSSAGAIREQIRSLTGVLRESGIPCASVFGDRDLHSALSSEEQTAVWKEYPLCLTGEGSGDYALPVYGEEDAPALLLWCLNSHAAVFDYEKKYGSPTPARLPKPLYTEHYLDGVHFQQSLWFWRESIRLEESFGHKIPGAVFCHIPLPEFVDAAMNANQTGLTGTVGGAVRCQTVNGGLFTAAAERHDIRTIVCAHPGNSSFTARYAGLDLVMTPEIGSPLGDGVLLTWKTEEDGTISQQTETVRAE